MAGCQCISNSLGPFKSSGFSFNDTAQLFMGFTSSKSCHRTTRSSPKCNKNSKCNYLVVEPTNLKHMSQIGNLPQFSG